MGSDLWSGSVSRLRAGAGPGGVVMSVVVIGHSPDRAAVLLALTTTTNGSRRIDIVDEEFLGDQPQPCPALEQSAALHTRMTDPAGVTGVLGQCANRMICARPAAREPRPYRSLGIRRSPRSASLTGESDRVRVGQAGCRARLVELATCGGHRNRWRARSRVAVGRAHVSGHRQVSVARARRERGR